MLKKKERTGFTYSYMYLFGIAGMIAFIGLIGLYAGDSTGSALKPAMDTPERLCQDSDGPQAWESAGYLKVKGSTYYDFCLENSYKVTDYYCQNGKAAMSTIDCRQLGLNYVCKESAYGAYCGYENPPATCSDTDSANDRFSAGNVYGYDRFGNWYNFPDYCVGSDLVQMQCIESEAHAGKKERCLLGCFDGACKQKSDIMR